jgi:hypothetical protein
MCALLLGNVLKGKSSGENGQANPSFIGEAAFIPLRPGKKRTSCSETVGLVLHKEGGESGEKRPWLRLV